MALVSMKEETLAMRIEGSDRGNGGSTAEDSGNPLSVISALSTAMLENFNAEAEGGSGDLSGSSAFQ